MMTKDNQTFVCILMVLAIIIGYNILKSLTSISKPVESPPQINLDCKIFYLNHVSTYKKTNDKPIAISRLQ
jgi:hypothetical protein